MAYKDKSVEKVYQHRYYRLDADKKKAKARERHRLHREYVDFVKIVMGGCSRCDETDPACLDFPHRDPASKHRSVSYMVNYSRERLLAEIDKCDLLCCNCHRKQHRDERLMG